MSRSAGLLQCVHDLLQDVGAVVCDLLQDRVGVLLQLGALSLALLQLRLQLQKKKAEEKNICLIHSDRFLHRLSLSCIH